MSTRDEALRLLRSLPDDASWEDVLRAISARAYAGSDAGEAAASRVRELQATYGDPPLTGEPPYHDTAGESEMGYQGRITIEAGKRGGKPCVRGMRITVYDVLGYLASGMSEEEILTDFPDLERSDIRACLAYAADEGRKLVRISA